MGLLEIEAVDLEDISAIMDCGRKYTVAKLMEQFGLTKEQAQSLVVTHEMLPPSTIGADLMETQDRLAWGNGLISSDIDIDYGTENDFLDIESEPYDNLELCDLEEMVLEEMVKELENLF